MADRHIAVINPDLRGRFALTKWIIKDVPYRVYALPDGVVRLEPEIDG